MPHEQRRLAAIASANVAGYSRLMSRGEKGALAALSIVERAESVAALLASPYCAPEEGADAASAVRIERRVARYLPSRNQASPMPSRKASATTRPGSSG